MKPQLTIEDFADWAEKQPADDTYDYMDPFNCAMTQYVKAIGFDTKAVRVVVGTDHSYFKVGDRTVHLPDSFEPIAWKRPRTFGALASRLRAVSQP